jgi:aspartyl-tRNA(Asn)/glutamyl-tRNA(Gln) amidotransferase subunit A
MYPFVDSLDHCGLFARTVADLAAAYGAMHDESATAPAIGSEDATLRVAMLGGWFAQPAGPGVAEAVARIADALGNPPRIELPHDDVARSAAFCITAAEGGSRHLANLRVRPQDFDHATRDRLIAGALLPAAVVEQAQRFRSWYLDQVTRLLMDYDILIAPATICSAPHLGEAMVPIDGAMLPVRANLGLFTQPISFIGLPVICAPVAEVEGMPLGVQIIAAPWREDKALRLAAALERRGVVASRRYAEAAPMPLLAAEATP